MPKSKKTKRVLGLLDKKTRLAADSHSFVLEKMVNIKDDDGNVEKVWTSRYFYSDLRNAIRGYVKHKARESGKTTIDSKPLLDLLDLVSNLEKTIEKVADKLSREWKEKQNEE